MQVNELRGRIIYPRTRMVSDTCPKGYYPTGGTLPCLAQDAKFNDRVKATVGLKFGPGRETYSKDILLPRQEFTKGNPHNTLGSILSGWNNLLPLDAICVNVPFKLSHSEAYAECTMDMFKSAIKDGSFYAIPIVSIDFGTGTARLSKKGGRMVPLKSGETTFNILYKGRYQYDMALPIPKAPAFLEKEYDSYDAGFISMLTQCLDAPIKDGQTTLFPKLLPYNFMATVFAMESYWKKAASIRTRASFSVSTKFQGDPMSPLMDDDRLAAIWDGIKVFKRVPVEVVAPPVMRTAGSLVVKIVI